ncbi:hypothetical protein MTP03_28630 [Tsukamurella sp. PLM1]|nr:hypothetical protein MTP03_28630 [Tsukamurella sp. PLM1]
MVRVLRWFAILVVLLAACYALIFAPELHAAGRRIHGGGMWFGRAWPAWLAAGVWVVTGVLALVQLLFLAVLYGYALMASVRRLYWCAHRRRAVRRWRPIAAAAGIGPVRRWLALRAGTNEPTKKSIRRLWTARTPRWLGRGLFLLGVVGTLGAWIGMGADLTSMPSGLFIFVLVAHAYLSDERAPSVFVSRTVGRHAKAD